MKEETITLVPKIVAKKAKELFRYGLYDSALEIMEQNKIECKVYTENVVEKRQRESSFHRKISPHDSRKRARERISFS